MPADTHPFLVTLQEATNAHDLDALVDCFDPAYRNEAPAHPSRDFQGSEQVRANWRQIFAFVPDVHASVARWAVEGCEVWSEWQMSGTRLDGTRHLMRGVIIFGVQDGRATWARFYLEPVEEASTSVEDAVSAQVHADTPT
ncbi:MAG: nuclear transport factor 2 family protein [Jatrophihabitans sp.]